MTRSRTRVRTPPICGPLVMCELCQSALTCEFRTRIRTHPFSRSARAPNLHGRAVASSRRRVVRTGAVLTQFGTLPSATRVGSGHPATRVGQKRKFSEIEDSNKKRISDTLQYQSASVKFEGHFSFKWLIVNYLAAIELLIEDLKTENEKLRVKIVSMQKQYQESQELLLKERQKTNELSSEVNSLKKTLAKKIDNLESASLRSPCRKSSIRLEDSNECLPMKNNLDTPSGQNSIQSENAAITLHEIDNENRLVAYGAPWCSFGISNFRLAKRSREDKAELNGAIEANDLIGVSEVGDLSDRCRSERTAVLAVLVRRPGVADGGFSGGKPFVDSTFLNMCRMEFLKWFLVDCFLAIRLGKENCLILLISCVQLRFVILLVRIAPYHRDFWKVFHIRVFFILVGFGGYLSGFIGYFQLFRKDLCEIYISFLVEIEAILSSNSDMFKREQKIGAESVINPSYSFEGLDIMLSAVLFPNVVVYAFENVCVKQGFVAKWKFWLLNLELLWGVSDGMRFEKLFLCLIVSWPIDVGAVVIASSTLFGSFKGSACGSTMLRRLLIDVCNDEVVVWSLVFQLFFEDQVLLVKDFKDLKFFGFSLVIVMRVVMITSSVGFSNDEVGYWLLEVVVSVMVLQWNSTGVVLACFKFTLSLMRDSDGRDEKLLYRVSSLGTIENVALEWMKDDMVFGLAMCPVFFDRVSRVVGHKC
ncbi:hypothetical protein MA16_Dca000391 [Dendrobium catenatum]|uniref:DUF7806 domain-containing protein n=1 Tax=Dendrobium catenatum TaxID=906689 RepID=A0A2I0WTR5_9ASPA|nr:hypothetical protein MA16_Dca000391 [Dendrobium catenatum]